MRNVTKHIGHPTRRVDGVAKVTGAAKFAGEHAVPGLLYGHVVSSTIPCGRIAAMHLDDALKVPGVVDIFTHEHRCKTAWRDANWKDEAMPPGHPFRPLHSDRVIFDGQPVALVVAESLEAARDAASCVRVDYEPDPHLTELRHAEAYVPPKRRDGIAPPPEPRGDADAAIDNADHTIAAEYVLAAEHHNPMELFATTCVWEGDGRVTIYEKTQGAQNTQGYVARVFNLKSENVRVINHYVGGAFGSALRPRYQLWCAVAASICLERSVRVTLTRAQMFTLGQRPEYRQSIALACDAEGDLQAVLHEATQATSRYEDYQEVVVNWSGLLYGCANVKLDYKLAQLDIVTPSDMRAPGAASGVTVLEMAIDELAAKAGIDPLELRKINYIDCDQNTGKDFTSKSLDACYAQGARAFGWSERRPNMRSGRELVGYGMSSGVWEAFLMKTQARAKLLPDGCIEVATATADIGTGTYTILAQVAAEALGCPLEKIVVRIGDSDLPPAPLEGGSWTAASAGAAVYDACVKLKAMIAEHPRAKKLEAKGVAIPDAKQNKRFSAFSHSAVFADVRIDEELGVIRVPRIVVAVAGGRILNPKTARSQILGGVVMGIGMALHEEQLTDHALGRVMNHNLVDYHIPVNADVRDIQVIFVDERDDKVSPLGVKGLGEIGVVGTASAIANAVAHATGKPIRKLPILLDALI